MNQLSFIKLSGSILTRVVHIIRRKSEEGVSILDEHKKKKKKATQGLAKSSLTRLVQTTIFIYFSKKIKSLFSMKGDQRWGEGGGGKITLKLYRIPSERNKVRCAIVGERSNYVYTFSKTHKNRPSQKTKDIFLTKVQDPHQLFISICFRQYRSLPFPRLYFFFIRVMFTLRI